jgi:hypothetical protein
MKLFRDHFIVILMALSAFLFVRSCEERKALDACIDDLAINCRGLYDYAITLEEENSRLNSAYRKCRIK